MLNHLSYKQKTRILIPVALISVLICYKLAISRTIEQYRIYREARGSGTEGVYTSSDIRQIKENDMRLNSQIDQFLLDSTDTQKNMLSISSNWMTAHDLELKQYHPPAYTYLDSFPVVTQSIRFTGGYIDCVKFIHALETVYKPGKLSTVLFKTETNMQTKKQSLMCTLFIQNIITHEGSK